MDAHRAAAPGLPPVDSAQAACSCAAVCHLGQADLGCSLHLLPEGDVFPRGPGHRIAERSCFFEPASGRTNGGGCVRSSPALPPTQGKGQGRGGATEVIPRPPVVCSAAASSGPRGKFVMQPAVASAVPPANCLPSATDGPSGQMPLQPPAAPSCPAAACRTASADGLRGKLPMQPVADSPCSPSLGGFIKLYHGPAEQAKLDRTPCQQRGVPICMLLLCPCEVAAPRARFDRPLRLWISAQRLAPLKGFCCTTREAFDSFPQPARRLWSSPALPVLRLLPDVAANPLLCRAGLRTGSPATRPDAPSTARVSSPASLLVRLLLPSRLG